ncbi:MAG: ABC transporter ATP-binding protein [Oscillospiraceae bacterium]|nr:ABC transporter ATP-binding protein [Oscillospiraceae bacterium]
MNKDIVIDLKDISVAFDGQPVLKNLNLYIRNREFITLLGPSGCGKTTTLRVIAGFLEPDSGDVIFDGASCLGVPPHKRQVNTIFQRYALFPHLNVYKNVAFGLKLLRLPAAEVERRVEEMLRTVNLTGFERRSVASLSGGQQQRVAIARALAVRPRVLLLDEPLGALDLKLRKDMQMELKNIQQQLGITFIYVTHDQEEALSMSDTIVVMDEGEIQQIGTPKDIYDEPKNAFVADFIGESNIVDGVMLADFRVRFAGMTFQCVDKGFAPSERVDVVVRPEDVDIVPPGSGVLQGTVTSVTFKGVHYEFIVDVQGFKWLIQSTDVQAVDDVIGISIKPDEIHIMKKSKYSDLVGDYSCFSDEFEEMSNPETDSEEEEE